MVGLVWDGRTGKRAHRCMIRCLQMAAREPREPHLISNLSGMHQARPCRSEAAWEVCGWRRMVGIAAVGDR